MLKKPKWSLSLNLFRIKGIPIRLHASCFLLLLWGLPGAFSGRTFVKPGLLFFSIILGCVFLNELAQALMARLFGIRTGHITLYPFGGVAAFEGAPKPKAEFSIAATGPASNFLMAALLLPWLTLESFGFFGTDPYGDGPVLPGPEISLGARFFMANTFLALLNLFPVLPMDGGRLLRSVLMLSKVRSSTFWAARISQALCLLLMLASLTSGEPTLLIIAVLFVFLGAFQEQFYERAATANRTVRDVVLDRETVITFSHGSTIGEAARTAVHSNQSMFPVLQGEELLGAVPRHRLQTAQFRIREGLASDAGIGEILDHSADTVLEDTPLLELVSSLSSLGTPAMIVLDGDGRFAGLLERERLLEFSAGERRLRPPEEAGG